MIKVVPVNDSGKVNLTKEELEDMLNDAYENGLREGLNRISYTTVEYGKRYDPNWNKITCKPD